MTASWVLAGCAIPGAPEPAPRPGDPVISPAQGDVGEPEPVFLPPLGEALLERLAQRMERAHSRLGRGRPAVTDLVWSQLGAGQTQGFTLELSRGSCYTVIAACATEDQEVDLILNDRRGEELERRLPNGSATALEVCPATGGAFRLLVRMYSGSGAFALQVFGS